MTALSSAYAGTVYDHKLKNIDGKETSLSEHKGKVILMVNAASKCGFTRQYKGLEELHQKFKDKGLVVCGFPCNQFGGQEPGTEKEIKEFCSTRYGVTFPMYSKVDVNGPNRHPLYESIIGEKGPLKGNEMELRQDFDREGRKAHREVRQHDLAQFEEIDQGNRVRLVRPGLCRWFVFPSS